MTVVFPIETLVILHVKEPSTPCFIAKCLNSFTNAFNSFFFWTDCAF